MPRSAFNPVEKDQLLIITGMLVRLGSDMAAARMNRQWRQRDLAVRAGLTRHAVMQIERGNPGVSIGAYVAALCAMGLADDVQSLASASRDCQGQMLLAARSGKRVRLSSRSEQT